MPLEIEKIILKYKGFRAKPHRCAAGKLTVGIGRDLEDKGITKSEAMFLLRSDIGECEVDLFKIFGKDLFNLSDNRRWALIYMRFNLGSCGFRDFIKSCVGLDMIKAVKAKNFKKVAKKMENSWWCGEIGSQNKELVTMMSGG